MLYVDKGVPMLFVEYPKCTTCKKAKKFLDDHHIEYTDRDIKSENPTAEEIAAFNGGTTEDMIAPSMSAGLI